MSQKRKPWIKPYEYWHPRIFELPFYIYLAVQCLLNRVSIRTLAKANYALDHGEIGIGSKLRTQLEFDQRYFLPTKLLESQLTDEEKVSSIAAFAEQHGYPVILKPDIGMVGKGIARVHNEDDIRRRVPKLLGTYLVQQYTPYPYECGIFYCRQQGQPQITGINRKHFPSVTGNGVDNLQVLAENHERFTHHWATFLQYHDTSRVPEAGEEVRLSFIGSHTMGCMFTDDSHILTEALQSAVFDLFDQQPGYNFGRIDVKAESEEAIKRGEFIVIEVNGISSLPTNMFDPKYTLFEAYKIFFAHGKKLAQIAAENRHQPMELLPHLEILNRVINNQSLLDKAHQVLKSQPSSQ